MRKICSKCDSEKDLEDYFKDKTSSDGRYSVCKVCKKKKTQGWREKNREKYNASMRAYRKSHKAYFRDKNLKRSYGIDLARYDEMYVAQDGKCLICQKAPDKRLIRPLAVDHCHNSKKVRGLLCYGCNRALHTLEAKNLLLRAIAYLTQHSL